LKTSEQWMMFFYLQTIGDCHFDLMHEGFFLYEYFEETANLDKILIQSFDSHIQLLSTSLWQN